VEYDWGDTEIGRWTFTRDAGGHVVAMEGPDGALLTFDRDGSIVHSVRYVDATETVDAAHGYTLDGSGRPESEDLDVDSVTRSLPVGFDADGLLISFGPFSIDRDVASGRIEGTLLVDDTDAVRSGIRYNAFGETELVLWTSGALPNPLPDNCSDDEDELTNLAGAIACRAWDYDEIGRISDEWMWTPTLAEKRSYRYDPVYGRLIEVDVNDVLQCEYAYDGNGVRTDLRELNDTPAMIREDLAEADGRDRILTYDGIVYVHDVDGTRVWERDPAGGIGGTHAVRCYTYDLNGALLEVEDGFVDAEATGHPCQHGSFTSAGFVAYAVDPMGRRTSRTEDASTVHWIYMDELNPVAQLDSDGALVQRYLYATSSYVPDALITYDPSTGDELARYRYITDARGSVVQVVRVDTGAVVQAITYGPWGEVLSDTNPGFQPFGYAGGLYDPATGLVRFGERDYDPRTGRWTARDPIGFAGGDTNLYAYVGGDPINYVDPTGLQGCRGNSTPPDEDPNPRPRDPYWCGSYPFEKGGVHGMLCAGYYGDLLIWQRRRQIEELAETNATRRLNQFRQNQIAPLEHPSRGAEVLIDDDLNVYLPCEADLGPNGRPCFAVENAPGTWFRVP